MAILAKTSASIFSAPERKTEVLPWKLIRSLLSMDEELHAKLPNPAVAMERDPPTIWKMACFCGLEGRALSRPKEFCRRPCGGK